MREVLIGWMRLEAHIVDRPAPRRISQKDVQAGRQVRHAVDE
jgi:hypothetical protein